MLEIQDWKETIIQNSATAIAISNYNESQVYVTIIDLKMRRQNQYWKFKLDNKPTKLFQLDSHNLLVGCEGGKIEHINLTDCVIKKSYDAHPESTAGISAIIEVKSKSPLLRGPNDDPNFKLIATASLGAPQYRLWRLNSQTIELQPYLKIETTFTDGIKYLLETQDNQLVAANSGIIKFYDFIDKQQRDANEQTQKQKEKLQELMKKLFSDLDKENTLKLNKKDTRLYLASLAKNISSEEFIQAAKVSDEAFDDIWYEFGISENGYLSWHSIKPMIARLLVHEA